MRAFNIAKAAVKRGDYEIDWDSRGNGESGLRFGYIRRGKDEDTKESWRIKEEMQALKDKLTQKNKNFADSDEDERPQKRSKRKADSDEDERPKKKSTKRKSLTMRTRVMTVRRKSLTMRTLRWRTMRWRRARIARSMMKMSRRRTGPGPRLRGRQRLRAEANPMTRETGRKAATRTRMPRRGKIGMTKRWTVEWTKRGTDEN